MRNLLAAAGADGAAGTRAVDELERELVGLERSMRAPFDKMLADLEALRARARGDVDEVQVAVAQFDSDVLIAKSVIGVAQKAAKEWTKRLKGVVSTTQGDVEALSRPGEAAEVDGLIKVAQPGAKAPDIQVVVDICDKALASLRRLEHHRVYGNVLARCADAISGVRASFRLSLTDQAWAELHVACAARRAFQIAANSHQCCEDCLRPRASHSGQAGRDLGRNPAVAGRIRGKAAQVHCGKPGCRASGNQHRGREDPR